MNIVLTIRDILGGDPQRSTGHTLETAGLYT